MSYVIKNQLVSVKLKIRTDCEIVSAINSTKPIKIIDIRPISTERVRHLISIPHSLIDKFILDEGVLVKKHCSKGKSCIVIVDKRPCTICKILYSANVFLSSALFDEEGYTIYSFLIDREGLNELLKLLKSNGIKYRIIGITYIDTKSSILSSTQEKVLFIALKMGLFDYPRRVTLKELASKLNLSPSTVDEIIRRGLKKLLKTYFERPEYFRE